MKSNKEEVYLQLDKINKRFVDEVTMRAEQGEVTFQLICRTLREQKEPLFSYTPAMLKYFERAGAEVIKELSGIYLKDVYDDKNNFENFKLLYESFLAYYGQDSYIINKLAQGSLEHPDFFTKNNTSATKFLQEEKQVIDQIDLSKYKFNQLVKPTEKLSQIESFLYKNELLFKEYVISGVEKKILLNVTVKQKLEENWKNSIEQPEQPEQHSANVEDILDYLKTLINVKVQDKYGKYKEVAKQISKGEQNLDLQNIKLIKNFIPHEKNYQEIFKFFALRHGWYTEDMFDQKAAAELKEALVANPHNLLHVLAKQQLLSNVKKPDITEFKTFSDFYKETIFCKDQAIVKECENYADNKDLLFQLQANAYGALESVEPGRKILLMQMLTKASGYVKPGETKSIYLEEQVGIDTLFHELWHVIDSWCDHEPPFGDSKEQKLLFKKIVNSIKKSSPIIESVSEYFDIKMFSFFDNIELYAREYLPYYLTHKEGHKDLSKFRKENDGFIDYYNSFHITDILNKIKDVQKQLKEQKNLTINTKFHSIKSLEDASKQAELGNSLLMLKLYEHGLIEVSDKLTANIFDMLLSKIFPKDQNYKNVNASFKETNITSAICESVIKQVKNIKAEILEKHVLQLIDKSENLAKQYKGELDNSFVIQEYIIGELCKAQQDWDM